MHEPKPGQSAGLLGAPPLSLAEGISAAPRRRISHERTWVGAVPVTAVALTLNDCALTSLPPDLLRQAARQALTRGLVAKPDLARVERALEAFGGIGG